MVHLAPNSGHALHLKSIDLEDLQAGLGDEPIDLSVQIAAATDNVLNGIQPVLPGCDLRVFAAPMFQKEKATIRLEDSADFLERCHRIGNGAEGPGAHDKIEGPVVIGQRFGGDMLDANGKRLAGASCRDEFRKKISGVHGMEPGNGLGIMWQIQSGADSQFQHFAMNMSEQFRA